MAVLSIQYFHHLLCIRWVFIFAKNITHRSTFDVLENFKGSSRIDWSFLNTDVAEFDLISICCSKKIEDPIHGIEQHKTDWENNS